MKRIAIVGSGPAAAACALALTRNGVRPVILDAAETLDTETRHAVNRIADLPPASWDPQVVRAMTRNPTVHDPVPMKLHFGSDYVYGRERWHSPMQAEGCNVAPTFALGGFSSVWAGAMLPARDADISEWPIKRVDLEDHYREVLKVLPLSAQRDDLEADFPLFAEAGATVPLPPQGARLLARLQRSKDRFRRAGLVFGRSRLAVRARSSAAGRGCVSCGLCLHGCAPGSIFSTSEIILDLVRRGLAEFRGGLVCRSFRELDGRVSLQLIDTARREEFAAEYDRVFIGAGAISTTRILLESCPLAGRRAVMLDSQKFLLPLITPDADGKVFSQDWPTLPAAFMDGRFPGMAGRSVHLQFSPMNDLVLKKLGASGETRYGRVWRAVLHPALSRMMVCWGGLHSDQSSRIELELLEAQGAQPALLRASARAHPSVSRTVTRVTRRLFRTALRAGIVFLLPALRIAAPGHGNHYGGTFPMRETPRHPRDTDRLGRPPGISRVHVIDAACLPSIPATTLGLNIMANAHRIGAAVCANPPLD